MGKKATFYLIHNLLVILTLALLAATIWAYYNGRSDPALHERAPLAALALPGLLLGDTLLLVWWLVRRRVWALVPLAALILSAPYLRAMFRVPLSRENLTAADLTLMSYNVHGFRTGDRELTARRIAGLAAEEGIDVLCMQEFVPTKRLGIDSLASLLEFLPYRRYEPGSSLAIFSRYPLEGGGYLPFDARTGNGALWTDLRIDGRPLRIATAHLQTTGVSRLAGYFYRQRRLGNREGELLAAREIEDSMVSNAVRRAKQAEALARMTDTLASPIVLCGDFNDTPASYTYRVVTTSMTDAFRQVGRGYGATFREYHGILRLDYAFYGTGIEPLRYRIPDVDYSDHRPVIFSFNLI